VITQATTCQPLLEGIECDLIMLYMLYEASKKCRRCVELNVFTRVITCQDTI
jgi:hypothetical protein